MKWPPGKSKNDIEFELSRKRQRQLELASSKGIYRQVPNIMKW